MNPPRDLRLLAPDPAPRAAAAAGAFREALIVALGSEEYGIDILRIREIIKPRPTTDVPRAPWFVIGVIAVRGQVIPVIDLSRRLRVQPGSRGAAGTRLLVVACEEELFGLLVDEVRHVVRLTPEQFDQIEAPPPILTGVEADFVAGVARPSAEADRLLILLQLDAILRFEVVRARRSAGAGASPARGPGGAR